MLQTMCSTLPMMSQIVKLGTLSLLVLAILSVDTVRGTGEGKTIILPPRDKRSTRNQAATNAQLTAFLETLGHNNMDLMRYTPTTPSPEDVNCYVEVPVTRRVGGRCVPLGRHSMGCQAGIFLAFSSECQSESSTQGQDDSRPGAMPGFTHRPNRRGRISQLTRRPRI